MKNGKMLDYEADSDRFILTVTVEDNAGSSASLGVGITVLDVNEPPTVDIGDNFSNFTIPEDTSQNTKIGKFNLSFKFKFVNLSTSLPSSATHTLSFSLPLTLTLTLPPSLSLSLNNNNHKQQQ